MKVLKLINKERQKGNKKKKVFILSPKLAYCPQIQYNFKQANYIVKQSIVVTSIHIHRYTSHRFSPLLLIWRVTSRCCSDVLL